MDSSGSGYGGSGQLVWIQYWTFGTEDVVVSLEWSYSIAVGLLIVD